MDRERGARRTVRCGLHGRFYDAWSGQGCPDCAKRTASSRPRRRGGWSAALLLLAGALGLAHWQGRLPVLANTIRVDPAPAPAPARRPPAPRADRLDVQALERFGKALAALLAEGRRELMTVGEPPPRPSPPPRPRSSSAPPATSCASRASHRARRRWR